MIGAVRLPPTLAMGVVLALLSPPSPVQADPVEQQVGIEVSDGETLVGTLYLPHPSGRFPTVLVMSPYGPATYSDRWLDEGYAHLNVDIRGSGRSGGSLCVFCKREQRDVYEVVEWVARQDWSDGAVGMYGGSYLAITALMGAARQPPHLKAIVPIAAYADPYRDIAWHNGMFTWNFVTQWTFLQAGLGATAGAPPPDSAGDRASNFVAMADAREHPFDGPFWRERAVYTKYRRIEVPTLLMSGWFDGFSRGNIWNFQGIAGEHTRLIMGPGTHKGAGGAFDPLSPYAGDTTPPGNPEDIALAWFDRFLKGVRNGVEKGPPIQYYDLGAFKWKRAATWPPAGTSTRHLYLSGERGGSAASLNDGSLTQGRPRGSASTPDSFSYDPAQGVAETFAKWGTLAATPHLRLDQRADEAHALTYTTAALKEPLTLAGPIELRMWAQTTASDTDWVVKVTDVGPDGASMLITSGYMRASHRAWDPDRSRRAEPWITNDEASRVVQEPLKYRIDIWHTAYELQKGHRLRVTIMSSDTPNHEPILLAARNTVFHDGRHPSELLLTVLP